MSIDVNEIYSKLKMNLGAANIDHVVRARYVGDVPCDKSDRTISAPVRDFAVFLVSQ